MCRLLRDEPCWLLEAPLALEHNLELNKAGSFLRKTALFFILVCYAAAKVPSSLYRSQDRKTETPLSKAQPAI